MSRILLILLLCMGMIQSSPAQQFFNKRDALHSFFSMLTSVAEVNGKYYCTGYCWDSINYIGNNQAWGIEGVKFAVFDTYGNKIIDTIYQKNGKDIAAANGKLLPQPDGSFLLAADETDTNGKWYLNIMRFDTTGKVIWEKEFPKPLCTDVSPNDDFWRLLDFQPDSFGNWLMLSTIVCGTPGNGIQHDMFLMKLDSSFNLIWQKQYGYPNMNDYAGKLLIEHDGYILAGGRSNSNLVQKNFIFNAEMYKVDASGNHLWHWLSDSQKKIGTIKDVIRTQDGGYLYCGMGDGYEVLSANQSFSIPEFKGWVEKIDLNRNVLWNKTINDEYSNWPSTEQRMLMELPDGNAVVAGSLWEKYSPSDTANHHFAVLTWIDLNGNTVRQRKYRRKNDTLNYGLYDISRTSDGGFVFCGEAKDDYFPYSVPLQRGWLVKVDSNGCAGPGDPQCWPTDVPHTPVNETVSVYPNPVHAYWFVSNNEGKKLEIAITDITGRTILQKQASSTHIQTNLSFCPSGIYLYRISSDREILLQGKLIKQ